MSSNLRTKLNIYFIIRLSIRQNGSNRSPLDSFKLSRAALLPFTILML